MFDRKKILNMYVPVLIDQTFMVMVGIVATIMVNSAGPEAVSGVGLVDSINLLAINVLNAMAVGATIVISQSIGKNDRERAARTGSQAMSLNTIIMICVAVLMLIFRKQLLFFLFGEAELSVINAADIYLIGSCIAYPFVAVTSTSAGILRAVGDNRSPMMASVIANIVNIIIAAALIYGLGLGVAGAAIGLVAARIASAIYLYRCLMDGSCPVVIKYPSFKFEREIVFGLLKISVPSSVDSGIFNGGKIVVQTFLAGMGTAAISANVIGLSLHSLLNLPAAAFAVTVVPIIGYIYGAGKNDEVLKEMKRLTLYAIIIQAAMSVLFLIFAGPFVSIYKPTPEAAVLTKRLIMLSALSAPLLWPGAFLTPNTLRAASDVKYTMSGSIISMILLRVFGAWFLGVHLGYGVFGIWVSMVLDWGGRTALFVPRAFGGFWNKKYRNELTERKRVKKL